MPDKDSIPWTRSGQSQQVKILNRIVGWNGSEGITYEADPRHVEIIVEQLGLKESKPVSPAGTRDEGRTQINNED